MGGGGRGVGGCLVQAVMRATGSDGEMKFHSLARHSPPAVWPVPSSGPRPGGWGPLP